ncbi:hypothetical protein F5J12DRAFT_781495 [Pisolithus orientalis]|uniref:uncharacterized protein n=1 Tax=Pisolithus orientalis TaxID=936130 RepID=UPI00222523F0|nr:uncharacterized protein F5J12DRAFT_781495 [Pisolithus orientalis]KAI6012586.1 hypothetical protein F5J12DRAFT_781495 [Pisolithus orientalis]
MTPNNLLGSLGGLASSLACLLSRLELNESNLLGSPTFQTNALTIFLLSNATSNTSVCAKVMQVESVGAADPTRTHCSRRSDKDNLNHRRPIVKWSETLQLNKTASTVRGSGSGVSAALNL